MNKKFLLTALFLLFYCYTSLLYAQTPSRYEISGLPKSLLKQVQLRLKKNIPKIDSLISNDQSILTKQIPNEIRKALQNFGYFNVTIEIESRPIQQTEPWKIYYRVELGPPVRIKEISINLLGEGISDVSLNKLITHLPMKIGQVYNTEAYEQTKNALFDAALKQGYLSAEFEQSTVEIDRQDYTAIITLKLNTGHLYHFGPIVFQKTIFNEEFLRRYLPFQTGDIYLSSQLSELQTRFNNSGYFQQIWVEALPNETRNYDIPIQIKLIPKLQKQYSVGIGYGTDTRLRASLGWESRYLNQWGHRLSAFFQLSTIQSSMQVVYSIPAKQPATDQYRIMAAVLKNNFSSVESFSKLLGLSSVSKHKHFQQIIFINYQIENFRYPGQTMQTTHLLTPGVIWNRTRVDNLTFAHKGYNVNLRIQGGLKSVLSDNSFIQTEIQGKYIHALFKDSRVILRGDIGYSVISPLTNFAPSLLFYAGGSQSVRGYSYQSLGPGQYLVVGSAEYQHQIKGNFYGALFYDAGNAFNYFPPRIRQSAGIGVLWASPLGPMELTIAKALNFSGSRYQLQFIVGPDFV